MKNQLESIINELGSNIPAFEKSNPEISIANVGWHIEHILLSTNKVIHRLSETNPKDYQWKFNYIRLLIFMRGKIPRGKAKAPKQVRPEGNITLESLTEHLSKTSISLSILKELQSDQFFEHPYFGNLKKKKTIYFLELHAKHHLAIIKDILK